LFAFEISDNAYSDIGTLTFTKDDILTLEKYISVNKKGFFEIDKKQAKADGVNNSLLNGRKIT